MIFLSLSLALFLPLHRMSVIVPLIYLPLFHSVPAFPFPLSIWFLYSSFSSTLIPFILCLELCLLLPLSFCLTKPTLHSAPSSYPGIQPHTPLSLLTPAAAKPGAVLTGKVIAAIVEPTF